MPPLKQRVEYKFHNAVVAERCSLLAARLFKAAGTAGIAADLPFGRILADITVGRQHISNQFEQAGKSYGAFLFGIENNKDFVPAEPPGRPVVGRRRSAMVRRSTCTGRAKTDAPIARE